MEPGTDPGAQGDGLTPAPAPLSRPRLLVVGAGFEGGLAVAALLLGWIVGIDPFARLSFTAAGAALGLAATAPLLLLALVAKIVPAPSLRRLWRTIDEVVGLLFARAEPSDLAIVSALAGIGEEALFRGFLQEGLSSALGPAPALAVASVAFGLVHFLSPAYALYATLVGAYLGGIYLVSGDLLAVAVAHGVYDFVLLVSLVRSRRDPAA